MARKSKPSFFKVLIASNFASRLRLPPLFVRNHGEILPENITLKAKNGESWVVKIEEDEGHHYFTQGWAEFVEDLELEMGTFLVFRLMGTSTLKVSVYGITGCLMEAPDGKRQTRESDPENVPLRRSPRNVKGKAPVIHTVGEEEEEVQYPVKKEPLTDDEDGPSTNNKTSKPRLEFVLKGHQLYTLNINKRFVEETGIVSKRAVVLEDPQGRFWPVLVQRKKMPWFRFDMSRGWPDFRRANRLVVGTRCLFEFIPDKNVIRVMMVKRKK